LIAREHRGTLAGVVRAAGRNNSDRDPGCSHDEKLASSRLAGRSQSSSVSGIREAQTRDRK
jgi:hypothetical protein